MLKYIAILGVLLIGKITAAEIVDVEVADLAKSIGGYHIICHPPTKSDLRAFHQSDEIRQPLSYLSGQSMIMADECDILLVIPYQKTHQSHGGTWLHA